jgi:D-3-phosphoglycerate dehydrogenase
MTFHVTIERDTSDSDAEIEPGLEPLLEDPEVEVSFLADDRGPVLEPADLRGADAFVSYSYELTEDSLAGVERLKIVTRSGAGYDNLDVDALTEHGVVAAHAPEGPTASAGQAATGMIIACAHNFPGYEHALREHGWAGRRDATRGFELQSATLGFIGMGLIGQEVLDDLRPFREKGLRTRVYDPYLPAERAEQLGVETVDLETLLATSDIVTIHAPLTEETRHMLGASEFRTMKESAYLVNTSRGGIYPDEVLARALREEWIAGAAVDVFEDEPDVEDNPLLDVGHVQVTPHISGPTRDGVRRMREHNAESILNLKNGDYPTNVLNPGVYETVYGETLPEAYHSSSFRR